MLRKFLLFVFLLGSFQSSFSLLGSDSESGGQASGEKFLLTYEEAKAVVKAVRGEDPSKALIYAIKIHKPCTKPELDDAQKTDLEAFIQEIFQGLLDASEADEQNIRCTAIAALGDCNGAELRGTLFERYKARFGNDLFKEEYALVNQLGRDVGGLVRHSPAGVAMLIFAVRLWQEGVSLDAAAALSILALGDTGIKADVARILRNPLRPDGSAPSSEQEDPEE